MDISDLAVEILELIDDLLAERGCTLDEANIIRKQVRDNLSTGNK